MLRIIRYFLPLLCFSFLSAYNLKKLNEEISDLDISTINIKGCSGVDQIIKIVFGEENKIEIEKQSENIILNEDNVYFNSEFDELYFFLPSPLKDKGIIKYLVTLKGMPGIINIKDYSILKCEDFYSEEYSEECFDISVKNNCSVYLKGRTKEQLIEIDNTSLYDASEFETKVTRIYFEDFLTKIDHNGKIHINASDLLQIFNDYKTFIPVLYAIKPERLEFSGRYFVLDRFNKK
ncbi:hypothetical protein GF385_01300 [Candidatus Dependentiae bacterium]|nr:hypothetical protein [Candidatus Dependentiae bacterium]